MKFISILALLFECGAGSILGVTFTNGSPAGFHGEVIWAVPTNIWPPPDKIWSYKVVPQEFSEAVISNIKALGSFTVRDQITAPADLVATDKKTIFFGLRGTKYLEILPTLGYLRYFDEHAQASNVSGVKDVPAPVVGVPNEEETTRLGLKYLRLAGIEVSQLATKPGTRDLDLHWERRTRGWTDQRTGKEMNDTNIHGVFFDRCIDGIPVTKYGDFFVSFGNNARVFDLQISWRNLKPYQLLDKFVTSEQVLKSIRNGQTPLPLLDGWPLYQIKTLTITNATPRYGRKIGFQPMDFVVPALQLDAIIDNGTTNRYIWFQTPIAE